MSTGRWERLFADLELAFEAAERRARDSEVADRTRRERALVPLGSRLGGHQGAQLELRLLGGVRVEGRLVDVGADWLAVASGPGRACLIPMSAVVTIGGLRARHHIDSTVRRFSLGFALREISRDRAPAVVTDVTGTAYEGTIDVVGKDFLDLAEHPIDEARRALNVRGLRTVLFSGLACVQTG
ncbi:hypothetical protein [Nostocoides jenkinsii]|uniref:Uncharacterized protein n=1 Tax=Nostocoides jenkinsii Ben 74 TaxID=1193518 RepID=A0A077M840_9MICO|nr:hypothetical protein [Tetrasphaera jenkinsii]CCI53461.1 conserved hypothetical protein [Tetrasphaera jenkinsii Ben 74]